jgi:hypothetical protein
VDFQADALQGIDPAVVLADIPGVQQGFRHQSLRWWKCLGTMIACCPF